MNEVYWDEFSNEFRGHAIFKRINNQEILYLLFTFLVHDRNMNICDIGCGAGVLYNILKEKYKDFNPLNYTGLDLSVNNINIAHELFPKTTFVCLDIIKTRLLFHDIIFSSEMLSHIRLQYQEGVIQKLVQNSRKLSLFSFKYSEIESYECKVKRKNVYAYYVFPNIDDILSFIKKIMIDHRGIYTHIRKAQFDFLEGTEYYNHVGNIIVEIK